MVKKLVALIKNAPSDLKKRLFLIFIILITFNLGVWVLALFAAHTTPLLLGLVAIAYGLGLRHAVDADHIAAIDNTTRKLIQDGKKPVAVGFFFSWGHSTVVIILSILVALSSSFVHNYLPAFQKTGAIVGLFVSSFFLILIGVINLISLIRIYKVWRGVKKGNKYTKENLHHHLHNHGFLTRLFHPILKSVTNSWTMYIVGFLFGLSFDTASEIALLSISAASGSSGLSVGEILLLPLAFTAGMSLLDTLDGVLMLGAYGWAYINPIRKLYYNFVITLISVLFAFIIGGIEVYSLLVGS